MPFNEPDDEEENLLSHIKLKIELRLLHEDEDEDVTLQCFQTFSKYRANKTFSVTGT